MMKKDAESDIKLPGGCAGRIDRRGGYVIPLILVVAGVGVLFGIGRLAMFRYQAQIRLDRQADLDKTLATRSALNWLSNIRSSSDFPGGLVPDPGLTAYTQFVYMAQSGTYTVRVQAVPPVYQSDWAATGWNDASMDAGAASADELTIGPTTNDVAAIWWPLEAGETWLNPAVAPFGRRYWVKPDRITFPGVTASGTDPLNPGVYNFVISLYLLGTSNYPVGTAHPTNIPHWVRVELDYAAAELRAGWSEDSLLASSPWAFVAHGFGVQLSQQSGMLLEWVRDEGSYFRSKLPAFPAEESQFPGITLYLEARLLNDLAPNEIAKITFEHVTVSPSYEFEIELSWAKGTNLFREIATYVNARPSFGSGFFGVTWNTYSYDTHGVSRLPEPSGD